MVQASDLSHFYSSQSSSSQLPPDEEAVEGAFWQGTPTALEELRQGTDDECHQAVSKDQDRPNDPLSLSTQQSRLIRQTWAEAAGSIIGRSSDGIGETQTSTRPKYRNRRGGGAASARPDSTTNATSSASSTVSSTDKSTMFFRHLNNIEKVCKTVDERMQKRKVQKEWSTKVISETARLRDMEDPKENMNTKTNMHGERSPSNDNADVAQVDAFDDDNDLPGLGTPQSDDRDLDLESMEEVPTSQSQERYLSPSQLSQMFPTGSLGVSRAPINGNHLGVPVDF